MIQQIVGKASSSSAVKREIGKRMVSTMTQDAASSGANNVFVAGTLVAGTGLLMTSSQVSAPSTAAVSATSHQVTARSLPKDCLFTGFADGYAMAAASCVTGEEH